MKFVKAIPLFCVALIGHPSVTWQSSVPSAKKELRVGERPCYEVFKRSPNCAKYWEMIGPNDYSDEVIVSIDNSCEKNESEVGSCEKNKSESNVCEVTESNSTQDWEIIDFECVTSDESFEQSPIPESNGMASKENDTKPSSSPEKQKHIFGRLNEKDTNFPSMNKTGLSSDNLLHLNLKKTSYDLLNYTKDYFSSCTYSKILLEIDEKSDLSHLVAALSGKKIIEFELTFDSNRKILFKILEIIKKENFQSLTFNSPHVNNKYAARFIRKLRYEIPFWSEMESLNLLYFSKKQIIETFHSLSRLNTTISSNLSEFKPLKLKYLSIIINRTNNEETGQLEIPFVEELDICFYHDGDYKHDIENILPIFPNAKKISIHVSGDLDSFKIEKNSKLENLEIRCHKLKNEDEFVKYLKVEMDLSLVFIGQGNSNFINWSKEK